LTKLCAGECAGANYPFLTQYERDIETGLDYAQARYYANTQGRFTGPDAYVIFFEMNRGRNARERAKILKSYASEPRNWNRYSYCLNDPVNLIDPSGLIWLTKDNENYQWVDDDKYRKEDWEGYTEVEAGTIAYFGEGWGGYDEKYKGLMGSYVTLNADGSLGSAGVTPIDEVDDPPSSSGYVDFNVSYGSPYFIGPTGGLMFDSNGLYPYIGAGVMNPGLGGSITGSNDSVSGGFNAELQGGYGPLYGSVGVDQEGNTFVTHGAGYGVGGTVYYVFGKGPFRPINNDARNSNSNSRGRERPGKSNCACNNN
jgi:RHS repeat-associated protein